MSGKWLQKYTKLIDFINNHPGIEINQSKWYIPEVTKTDFYALFDSIRFELAEQSCPDAINQAMVLVASYKEAIDKASEMLHLEKIAAPSDFGIFLQNPKAALIKPLFSPLFDLIKGRIDIDTFESKAMSETKSLVQKMQSSLYEKWIVATLIIMLKPDELYRNIIEQPSNPRVRYRIRLNQYRVQNVPRPEKTNVLSWEPDSMSMITLPDFIIRSSILDVNKYVAIKTRFTMATHPAAEAGMGRKWHTVNADFNLDEDTILVYTSNNLMDLSAIAQAEKISQPDLTIKYIIDANKNINQWLKNANDINRIMQPSFGGFLVSGIPLKTQDYTHELEENMHLLGVGLEEKKLSPVVEKLLVSEHSLSSEEPSIGAVKYNTG